MTAAFEYLGRITDRFFETQMRRMARKISERLELFSHHPA